MLVIDQYGYWYDAYDIDLYDLIDDYCYDFNDPPIGSIIDKRKGINLIVEIDPTSLMNGEAPHIHIRPHSNRHGHREQIFLSNYAFAGTPQLSRQELKLVNVWLDTFGQNCWDLWFEMTDTQDDGCAQKYSPKDGLSMVLNARDL